jgi:hypothetical protein
MGVSMRDRLVGTWLLERFLIENIDGEIRDWGRNSKGQLIYTENGYMSVSINREVENKSSVEAQNYFDSILFYSGTFTVDKDIIKHQVKNASNPNRIGKELVRHAKLDGNLLTLTSPKESFGKAILTWGKVI